MQSEFRREKIVISTILLVISMAVLLISTGNQIYPFLPVGALTSTVIILIAAKGQPRSYGCMIGLVTGISVFYRVFTFNFPPSLIGVDPDRWATNIQKIVNSGSIEPLNVYFYSDAPLYFIIGAEVQILSGMDTASSMIVFPVILGFLMPTGASILTKRLTGNLRTSIVAGTIAAITTMTIWLAYWPIPQSLATAYWIVFFLSVILYQSTGQKATLPVTIVSLIGIMYTHKMPFIILALAVLGIILFHLVHEIVYSQKISLDRRWVIIGSIVSLFVTLQWLFLTNFGFSVVLRSARFFRTDSLTIQSPIVENPSHAVSAFSGLFGIFIRRTHAFVLLPISGLGWLYLLLSNKHSKTAWIVLNGASAAVIFVAIGVINPLVSSPLRAVLMGEIFFAVLVSVLVSPLYENRKIIKRGIGVLILIGVLTSQLGVVYAAPDNPHHARVYLSNEEVQGKVFGHEHITGSVRADAYYANERTPYELRRGITYNTTYIPMTAELLNAELRDKQYEYVAHRTEVQIYRLPGGIWQLTWDPEAYLNNSYDQIYSNGGVDFYHKN